MKNIIIILILIIVVAALAAIFSGGKDNNAELAQKVADNDSEPEQVSSGVAKAVFDLEFKNYEGNFVRLADFKGTPLVVNSWAAWCPFCRNELPDFKEAQLEFGENVKIIAINRQESLAVSKKYSDDLEVSDELIMLLDDDDSFYKAIGGFAMPETIFINSNGEIIEHKRGPMSLSEIRDKIEKIVN